ncbi:MAG: polysaccharide biosynthesis/export family protein, partial [Pyrinomonadaceae bacterium]
KMPAMTKFLQKSFRIKPRVFIILLLSMLLSASAGLLQAQTDETSGKNNPYSPSPNRSSAKAVPLPNDPPATTGAGDVSFLMQRPVVITSDARPTEVTFKTVKSVDTRVRPPTELYNVGAGDVLFVNLKNSPQGSGYYTVRANGTIDFPLAGENVVVSGRSVESIVEVLASSITLFSNPQIEVRVRQFASHKITVLGLVENAGEKSLQREAMPLFVIRAEASVKANATTALVTRANSPKAEIYDLKDAKTDAVLIYPGDSIEFVGELTPIVNGAYFIAGDIMSAGKKDLTYGITLYQAVIASGGSKGDPKRVIIRRKDDKGLLINTEYNLHSIKEGRSLDPVLVSGDILEIGN